MLVGLPSSFFKHPEPGGLSAMHAEERQADAAEKNELAHFTADAYPVAPGHRPVIRRRHVNY